LTANKRTSEKAVLLQGGYLTMDVNSLRYNGINYPACAGYHDLKRGFLPKGIAVVSDYEVF